MSNSKKAIRMAVTAFTQRVIEARYGPGPLTAGRSRNPDLYHQLQTAPVAQPSQQRLALLTCTIEFHLPANLAAAIRQRGMATVALALHAALVREMYLHTASQVLAGREAWTALTDFYEMHRITDADWAFDTAYRNWLRYQQRQLHTSSPVRKVVNRPASENVRSTVHLLLADLDGCRITPAHVAHTLDAEMKLTPRRAAPLHAWLLRHLCQLTGSQTATRLRCTRRNAFARCRSMEKSLNAPSLPATRLIKALSILRHRHQFWKTTN